MQLNLIKLRKTHNLTQDDMSKILGITEETYGKKERSIEQFKADEMFAISEFFGFQLDQIFLPREIGNDEFLTVARR